MIEGPARVTIPSVTNPLAIARDAPRRAPTAMGAMKLATRFIQLEMGNDRSHDRDRAQDGTRPTSPSAATLGLGRKSTLPRLPGLHSEGYAREIPGVHLLPEPEGSGTLVDMKRPRRAAELDGGL